MRSRYLVTVGLLTLWGSLLLGIRADADGDLGMALWAIASAAIGAAIVGTELARPTHVIEVERPRRCER